MNSLPDISKSFDKLKIIMDLMAVADQSVFADAVRMGLLINPESVIEMILSQAQAQDNEKLVADIIGRDLLTRIQKVFV